jgi:serine/threonine protein kinase
MASMAYLGRNASPMAQLTSGALIAGYRVDGLAGHGGMGVVYRATQLSLGRTVALKLIAPALAGDRHFRERFERESRLAASIDHPNVLPVYEAGETDGTLFIAMRWVDGTDLRTLIHRGGGIEPRRATRIVGQVAAGLDAAHQLGLVHRDVKPANILIVAGADHAYLTDFGLMKRIRGGDELTDSGEFVGTIDYIAPEQIRGDGCDARSDVYSLGCVLFHSVSGRVPFDAESGIAKIYAHLNEAPPRASSFTPALPAALDEVVARAMAKDPDARYASAGDFARAAADASAQTPVAGVTPASATAPARTVAIENVESPPRGQPRRRHTRALAAIAILVAAGAAAAGLALRGSDDQHGQPPLRPTRPFDNGTLLTTGNGSKPYIVKAGARFAVPSDQRAAFSFQGQDVRNVSTAALRRVPTIPREGSLVRAYRSTLVWRIRDGTRQVIEPPPGADIAIIPSTGLGQIPAAPGSRRTQVTVKGPSFVFEHRRFLLTARVRSPSGVPTGVCVFYRVSPGRRKERANTPTSDGRCSARLKVSGFEQVRYSVGFIGDRGWRSSKVATPFIDVLPG